MSLIQNNSKTVPILDFLHKYKGPADSSAIQFALPPCFKYTEEQSAHKKQAFEEEEHSEASSAVTVPQHSPFPSRFNYTEEQLIKKQDLEEDFEANSVAPSTTAEVTQEETNQSRLPS